MLAIETHKLSKSYGELLAAHELDLAIEQGEIFGFLGSNGAGKTTTISMLTGQLRPTSGRATVMGQVVSGNSRRLSQLMGIVFEYPNLYPRLSAWQNLHFAAQLYDVPNERIHELLEQMDLAGRANDRIEHFSTGMKQLLSIARALLHRPAVLFLDEPTSGLDAHFARGIRERMRKLKDDGTTVFLTTHNMEEAEQLCDRVAFIKRGKIVLQDAPANLKRRYGKPLVTVELKDGCIEILSLEDESDKHTLATWSEAGSIATIHSQEASLEDVFVEVVEKEIRF